MTDNEIKEKVINQYINTRRPIKSIAKENDLSYEEVIGILQKYQDLQKDRLIRKQYNNGYMLQPCEITDAEIYEQREKGLSYQQIVNYFKDNGKEINCAKVREVCQRIYKEKNTEVKNSVRVNRQKIKDSEIYKLREKKLSYEEIAQYFTTRGRKISRSTVRVRCKEIYIENQKKENMDNRKSKNRREITDLEIYAKRLEGLSFYAIAEYFTEQGRKISHFTARRRFNEINNSKQTKKINDQKLKDEILRLKETKGATDEQINKIASIYGVDLNISKNNMLDDER